MFSLGSLIALRLFFLWIKDSIDFTLHCFDEDKSGVQSIRQALTWDCER